MNATVSQTTPRKIQVSVIIAPGAWLLPSVMLGGYLWYLLIASLMG